MDIIIKQIVILLILAITGFACGRTGYLPKIAGDMLAKIVIKLTAPILIVTTMAGYSFSREILVGGALIYIFAIVFILISYIIACLVSNRLKLSETTKCIYKMQSMFGNVVFLAFPLISSLFGEKGMIYAIFYNMANDTILWTLGIFLVNKHNSNSWKDNLKPLVNANTISFALGIILIALNSKDISYPFYISKAGSLLLEVFGPLGKTTIYLSMIFIGLILSGIKISGFRSRYPIIVLSLFKLIIVPAAAFLVLGLVQNYLHFDRLVTTIVVLQLSMPCATIVTALASQYGSDYMFATENVFITTIFSIITLPAILYMTL